MKLLGWFSFRQLRHKPYRTLLSTLSIALGVSLYTSIDIVNFSTIKSFDRGVEAISGKAQLSILGGQNGMPESVLERAEKHPAVQSAVPMIETQVYFEIPSRHETMTLMVLGIDLLKESQVRTYQTEQKEIIEDPLVFLNQPDSIILTRAFAEKNGFQMDSKIKLATSKGLKSFTVRGLLDASGPAQAYGGNLVIMDIDGARMMFGKEGKTDRIDLVLKPELKIQEARALLEKEFSPSYSIESPETQAENLKRLVQGYQGLLSLIGLISLLVGLFLVLNTMSISIHERRRDFGIMSAVGATQWSLFRMVLFESALLGLMGSTIGILLGQTVAKFMVGLIAVALSTQYMMPFNIDELVLTATHWVKAVGLGTLTSMIAGSFAAKSVFSVQPIEAVKKMVPSPKSASWVAPLVGAILYFLTSMNWIPLLNPFFMIIGSVMISPFMVRIMIRVLNRISRNPVLKLATGNLLLNASRTGSNIMTLMVGFILVIIIAFLNVSIKQSLISWFDRTLAADLIVSSSGKLMTFQVQPLHENLVGKINTLKGVDIQDGIGAYGMRYVKQDFQGKVLAIKAFDRPHPKLFKSQFDIREGDPESAIRDFFSEKSDSNSLPSAMVSQNFKLHFKLGLNDVFQLNTPTGEQSFRIVGVVSEFANPEGVLYFSRSVFKKYWKDDLITGFMVMVQPGVTPESVQAELDQSFGKSMGVMATLNRELSVQARKLIEENFAYTQAIEWSAILVGLFGLLNTLMVSVLDRIRELGVLRAVGMSRGGLMQMIVGESILQGWFGSIVAIMCGLFVSYFWVIAAVSAQMGFVVNFYFDWAVVLKTLMFGLGIGILAGLIPSKIAARMEIVECLQENR